MKYVKLFLLTVVVLCSFSNEKIPKIDLPAHTPKQTAQMSKLFRKVRYVPLETTDDCLLSYIHDARRYKIIYLPGITIAVVCLVLKMENFIRRIGA